MNLRDILGLTACPNCGHHCPDCEESRRSRRSALAIKFRDEVRTWSAEKLRRAYAQPEAVREAERREAQDR